MRIDLCAGSTLSCSAVEHRQAALRRRADWFRIDNGDLPTKRVFSVVMLLLSLGESSRPGQPPLITIPAG